MRLGTLVLILLPVLLAGCVERYDFKHVSDDVLVADAGDGVGGDASPDAAEITGDGRLPDTCEADCGGKVCGPDGCDGVCGTCGPDEECQAGMCVVLGGPDSCYGH